MLLVARFAPIWNLEKVSWKLEDEAIWKLLNWPPKPKSLLASQKRRAWVQKWRKEEAIFYGQRQQHCACPTQAWDPHLDDSSQPWYKTDRILRRALKEELADTTKLTLPNGFRPLWMWFDFGLGSREGRRSRAPTRITCEWSLSRNCLFTEVAHEKRNQDSRCA